MAIGKTKADRLDYEGFVEKFKPRRTTDDCMTPPEVYEAVLSWASGRFGIRRENVVRPFWPERDYESLDYPDGCVVLDNPPFSILSRIKRFYEDRGIRYLLFCPSLTAVSGRDATRRTHIVCDANVTYENGAVVRTGFVTNMGGDVVLMSSPELGRMVNEASDRAARHSGKTRALPRYDYPDAVVTAAMACRYAKYGVEYEVRRADCCRIGALDQQRAMGKTIFGGALLLSERAAAERAAATRFELSERERRMQRMLGRGGGE